MTKYLLVFANLLLCSCATIFTGTKDNVTFNSNPEGAQVLINGIPRGTTPTTIAVERPGFGSSNTVTIKKEGYSDVSFAIAKSFNGVSIVNLALIFGWAIDAVSGSIMKNDPTYYDLSLEKKRAAALQTLNAEQVAFLHELHKDNDGNMIVPNSTSNGNVAVVNAEENIAIVFSSNN